MKPSKGLAVVACMDCRLDVEDILDIETGEAHVIRNAGGVITDDVVRSLCLSQRELGTRRIVLLHHTDCGLQGVDEDRYFTNLEAEVGDRPSWGLQSFDDAATDVLESVAELRSNPFVPHTDDIRGYVFDVATAELVEITSSTAET